MIKIIAASALLGFAMMSPAYAQDKFACDEPAMTKMKTDIDALTDPAMKDAAMKEYDMAMEAMKANDMEKCRVHGDNAGKSIGGK